MDRGRNGRSPGHSPLRTVRADLPHTALRSVVHRRSGLTNQRRGCGREHPTAGEWDQMAKFAPITEVASVRVQRKIRLVLLMSAEGSDRLGPRATRYRGVFRMSSYGAPTFLPPFARRPLRRLNATMEALTPARLSPAYRSPCFTYSTFLTIPSPTTLCSSVVAFPSATLFVSATDLVPLCRALSLRVTQASRDTSRLHHSLAGSPETPGRNGFVSLRTGRSPPAAPHPASRQRSCRRLQVVA